MINDVTEAKPGAGTPGLTRLGMCGLLALNSYFIGLAGANLCLPVFPAALDSAGRCAALLWGGLQ
jgi:hypothetical protein